MAEVEAMLVIPVNKKVQFNADTVRNMAIKKLNVGTSIKMSKRMSTSQKKLRIKKVTCS